MQKLETGSRLEIAVYRGSDHDDIKMDDDRGVFFSTDEGYAASYGSIVRSYNVILENPLVVSEAESHGTIEIDREILLAQGYDGRVVAYDDGELDVVAFGLDQIEEVPSPPALR